MADSALPEANLELQLPGSMLDDLAAAAASRGTDAGDLARDWIQDRLVHEREKREGLAHHVRRP
jgi:hypothetical protein